MEIWIFYDYTIEVKHSVIFLSHGGGPLPLMGEPTHKELISFLSNLSSELIKPRAIILISAHWESSNAAITASEKPALIYDYSGFPPETYQVQYAAPGHSALAKKVEEAFNSNHIEASLVDRGFDHGMFVPLKLVYPEADIPCIQVSLVKGLNSKLHIDIGKSLASILDDDILVVGSGFSFHNMQAFFSDRNETILSKNRAFEFWLQDTMSNRDLNEQERERRLINWPEAPSARFCHPREEHLLPLHVCYGIKQMPTNKAVSLQVAGFQVSSFLW